MCCWLECKKHNYCGKQGRFVKKLDIELLYVLVILLLSIYIYKLEVPKTTLKFNNSLEVLTELKNIYTHGHSLLQWKNTD